MGKDTVMNLTSWFEKARENPLMTPELRGLIEYELGDHKIVIPDSEGSILITELDVMSGLGFFSIEETATAIAELIRAIQDELPPD